MFSHSSIRDRCTTQRACDVYCFFSLLTRLVQRCVIVNISICLFSLVYFLYNLVFYHSTVYAIFFFIYIFPLPWRPVIYTRALMKNPDCVSFRVSSVCKWNVSPPMLKRRLRYGSFLFSRVFRYAANTIINRRLINKCRKNKQTNNQTFIVLPPDPGYDRDIDIEIRYDLVR